MDKNFKDKSVTRLGIKDMWNAYLVKGAKWTEQGNPIVKTTAISPPKEVVSYKTARSLDRLKQKNIGFANYPWFKEAKRRDVRVIQYDGDTARYYKHIKEVCND